MNNTEVVNTPALRNGDIVLTWGMRVKLSNRTETQYGDELPVIHFDGLVTNPDEVIPYIVNKSMRTREGWEPGTYWAIQGNGFARWTREVHE
jgi:hypothetical protein